LTQLPSSLCPALFIAGVSLSTHFSLTNLQIKFHPSMTSWLATAPRNFVLYFLVLVIVGTMAAAEVGSRKWKRKPDRYDYEWGKAAGLPVHSAPR
jgi:hypothetical protein